MLNPHYDVIVVGAGAAGIAAAVCSARAGQSTLLIERNDFLGGTVVKGAITTLCGLYLNTGAASPHFIYTGFTAEFVRALMEMDGVDGPQRMGRLYVLPFRPESFQALSTGLIADRKNLQAVVSAELTGIEHAHGRIERLHVNSGGRSHPVEAGAVIDCSGDAVVARMAGHALMEGNPLSQVPAVMIPVMNVTGALGSAARRIQILLALQRAVSADRLPKAAAAITFMPTLTRDTIVLKLNLGTAVTRQGLAPGSLNQKANELVSTLLAFLKIHVAEFTHCRTPRNCYPVLYRTGARVVGKYLLKGTDILDPETFPDPAALGCWPIEKWDGEGKQHLHYPPPGRCYQIPSGALQAKDLENLLMAGKCISADDDAIASARMIACCLATGEAAGHLAGGVLQSRHAR